MVNKQAVSQLTKVENIHIKYLKCKSKQIRSLRLGEWTQLIKIKVNKRKELSGSFWLVDSLSRSIMSQRKIYGNLKLEFSKNSQRVDEQQTNQSVKNFGAHNGLLVNFDLWNSLQFFDALRVRVKNSRRDE